MEESDWLDNVRAHQASAAAEATSRSDMDNPYWGVKNRHDFDAAMIQKTMDQQFNAAEAQKQRDYDYYIKTHQYGMLMQDLKENGVNPYYLFSQGSSASSAAGGSSASSSGMSIPSGSKAGTTAIAALGIILKLVGVLASI